MLKCCSTVARGLKSSVVIPIPKKSNTKECSNYHTIALISHASKVMLKFSKPGFNSMWTMNFQMIKLVLEKSEEPEMKLQISTGSLKQQEFQKNIYFCFIDYAKAFDCVDSNKLWKILQEMGIPDHLTYLLRNLYASQEATIRTGHGTTDWFQTGKGVCQGCILSLCLFNLYVEYIMRNAGLDEAQAGIKSAGRNINNLRHADDITLMAESEEELKSLLIKVKEEWKYWLKTRHSKNKDYGIWSHHLKANRWGNSGNMKDFIFLGSKITADGDCSHEIKRRLLRGGRGFQDGEHI